jgi:hypothetical protein
MSKTWIIGIYGLTLLALTGCPCRDGGFTYNATVVLHDSSGQPLQNIRVALFDERADSPAEFPVSWPGFVLADGQGVAKLVAYTGNRWGRCGWHTEPPIPDNPGTLYLWVEYPQNTWMCYPCVIQEQQIMDRRPSELDIDLGTIEVAR